MKTKGGVLLDTSFFLRFLNVDDPLFKNADDYFRYFIENKIPMYISTISVAEYCVRNSFDELPLRNLRILPFNIPHAIRTAELAKIAFDGKKNEILILNERRIIPNDTKLFAKADSEVNIGYYISSDAESQKIYDFLFKETKLHFQFVGLNINPTEKFSFLFF